MFCRVKIFLLLIYAKAIFSQNSEEVPVDGFFKREFSLSKPYSGSGMTMPFWDFRDNVIITNNFIRLTSSRQAQRGAIWSNQPCHLRDWEFQVNFKIHGGGRTLAADGIALWYTKDKMVSGSVFGSQDQFDGLGVFLDTYKNGDQAVSFPLISAMIGNGTVEYDHGNDGKKHSIGSCVGSIRNKDYDTIVAVRYAAKKLLVKVDVDGIGKWRTCIELDEVTLPTGYYFGVSAATGDLADNHDVLSLKFYQLDVERTQKELAEDWSTARPGVIYGDQSLQFHRSDNINTHSPMSSFKIFFISLFIGIVVCLLLVAGFFMLKKYRDQSLKRFY